MRREVHSWYSPRLQRHMEIVVYGHWGFALLLFPTDVSDALEYERQGVIAALASLIDAGKLKVFSVSSVTDESWLNQEIPPVQRALRQEEYNGYIVEEVVPFIRSQTSRETMIITAGASVGAFLAANSFFRRPDIFDGMVAMSGTYDVRAFSDGYYDKNCYINSPVDFLPNIQDEATLAQIRLKGHIYVLSGKGYDEAPEHAVELAEILAERGIPCHLDLWADDASHDWPTWRAMLSHVLSTRF